MIANKLSLRVRQCMTYQHAYDTFMRHADTKTKDYVLEFFTYSEGIDSITVDLLADVIAKTDDPEFIRQIEAMVDSFRVDS